MVRVSLRVIGVMSPLSNQQRRKVAFVRAGDFSHVNQHALDILRAEFGSAYDILDIDIGQHVSRRNPHNVWTAIREYSFDILRGRKRPRGREPLVRNSHFFQEVRQVMDRVTAGGNFAFTLQTQSLWDASSPGIPHFVYTDHTHLANLRYEEFDQRALSSEAWMALEREIYANARQILVTSEFARHSLMEDYQLRADQVVCVYSGMNADIRGIATQQAYEEKNILFVGVDWERKGGPELLEAFRIVLQIHPDARLTIVGCSPRVSTPNTFVVGQVPRKSVADYYRQASIFCLPSVLEPSAVALVEAAAHALPVVATRVGGTEDRVLDGRTGFLVEPRNPQQLAEALLKLLADPQKRWAMGGAGRRLALDRFVWEKVGQKMAQHIRQSLAETQTHPAARYVS